MNNQPNDLQQTLDCRIPGFHQYCLSTPDRLAFASRDLCVMLGTTRERLMAPGGYFDHVHPGDKEAFRAFLRDVFDTNGTVKAHYRLVKEDGSVLYVSDSATKYPSGDTFFADSVLTDITALKAENQDLQYLNSTVPCGFLRYTCDKTPRITYINDQMKAFLGIPQGPAGEEWLELYGHNIFLLIPPEDRRRFSVYLDQVSRSSTPIAGEMTVLRCDGTRICLFGWVTKSVNDAGIEEYQSACMDITQRQQQRRERETKRYLKALTEVYDKIFEYDLPRRTVKCLYGQKSPMFRWIENIPMQMEEATERWILDNAFREDREALRTFFADFYSGRLLGDTPPVIRYRALSSDGKLKTYTGLFVKLENEISLFCVRTVPEAEEAELLRSENTSLRGMNENMQRLVMRFTDGLAAFEILGDVVTPLYASENVCQFFGFSREEWLTVMKKRTPIREFVSRSKVAYEDFAELLEAGEAEFTYHDLRGGRERRIKAICSQKSPDPACPRYVMLYNVEEDAPPPVRVRIRTFGYFDVFVDEKPIAFRNEKSKELFALLVDRRGGFVSSEEAISFLWEEEPANSVTLARYRKVALRLKNILEEYGISHIVESVNGQRRLATDQVHCDLYDYLSGREEYAQLFKGSYLTNYSWGETTLAELTGTHLLP